MSRVPGHFRRDPGNEKAENAQALAAHASAVSRRRALRWVPLAAQAPARGACQPESARSASGTDPIGTSRLDAARETAASPGAGPDRGQRGWLRRERNGQQGSARCRLAGCPRSGGKRSLIQSARRAAGRSTAEVECAGLPISKLMTRLINPELRALFFRRVCVILCDRDVFPHFILMQPDRIRIPCDELVGGHAFHHGTGSNAFHLSAEEYGLEVLPSSGAFGLLSGCEFSLHGYCTSSQNLRHDATDTIRGPDASAFSTGLKAVR
jgi:hypothetical protein